MGTTLADIWYLVFGGISQVAEKRKLKYSYALQEFEKELKEKIDKIPEKDRNQSDTQIIALALESAKYCIEKEELRHMFVELISSSLNNNVSTKAHPSFVHTIANLSTLDAKILFCFSNKIYISFIKPSLIISSLEILHKLGILENKRSSIVNIDFNESLPFLSHPYKLLDNKKSLMFFR